MKNQKKHSSKLNPKQVAAILGIVLLVLLYLITFIVAFIDQSSSGQLFRLCLLATFTIPLLIWVYIWMYGKLTQKHTIADLETKNPEIKDKKQ